MMTDNQEDNQEDEFRGFKVKDELYILFPLTIYGDGECLI